jgi:hypothetical protein
MATMAAVSEVIDERAYGHGWWYYLKPGWKRRGYETHALRADTKREINQILREEVVPCDCPHCSEHKKECEKWKV